MGATFTNRPLGRQTPLDFQHVEKYPFKVARTVSSVEKVLKLPTWHWTHDQGSEGSCVGHGTAMERAITNIAQNLIQKLYKSSSLRYDPIWIWNQAKVIDGSPSTNVGDDNGTWVSSAYDVMRDQGPLRCKSMEILDGRPRPVGDAAAPNLKEGAVVNQWARTTDEMRTALSSGLPVTIGVNWYDNFDNPQSKAGETWIGRGNLGVVRGGHCVCIYGASDKRQAFRVKNSWGRDYPLVWLPYAAMQRLLDEAGEACLVIDR